ncbi:hypothetical protein TIFTF001_041362 [Ficus carica]|uniref:Uncharacterized protein n=1 Tax=Ficus carica TaxID=3494 RepID=A0AA87Z4B2_FICCA|nr:hypothetical protein TIFTF001_041353 [Ficus carica]GMN29744.1 hypothetical protein TIFTF001_041356 [Ficus carica]GMN29770.1 hypothetical protein TIFTF001_041359 [Ficus carica]GMN29789.1 hypothetical protein TIFTF001_041362 [Ficus carica]
MDIVFHAVASIIGEFVPLLCCGICTSTKNCTKLHSNLNELEVEMKKLMDLRDDIQHKLGSADQKGGNSATSSAVEWLREVEELVNKVNTMKENTKVARMLDEAETLQISSSLPSLFESNLGQDKY